jgi:hypothetical protein
VEAGFSYPDRLARDEFLRSLGADPEFADLIATARRNSGAEEGASAPNSPEKQP